MAPYFPTDGVVVVTTSRQEDEGPVFDRYIFTSPEIGEIDEHHIWIEKRDCKKKGASYVVVTLPWKAKIPIYYRSACMFSKARGESFMKKVFLWKSHSHRVAASQRDNPDFARGIKFRAAVSEAIESIRYTLLAINRMTSSGPEVFFCV
jgi:hypothetical protein